MKLLCKIWAQISQASLRYGQDSAATIGLMTIVAAESNVFRLPHPLARYPGALKLARECD